MNPPFPGGNPKEKPHPNPGRGYLNNNSERETRYLRK